jgi:hypothetical protein
MLRIIINIILALSILTGWWFVALPLGLFAVWKFPLYIEIIVAGIGYDALFGFTREAGVYGYLGTILTSVVVIFVLTLKKVMR